MYMTATIYYSRTIYKDNQTIHQDLNDFLDRNLHANKNKRITLDLSFANLSIQELETVFVKIRNHSVVGLSLKGNHLDKCQLVAVFKKVFSTDSSIRNLDLQYCNIDDQDAIALTALMNRYRALDLDLTHNNIGPAGAVSYLREAVDNGFAKIDLSHNKIGDDGARLIAEALAEKSRRVNRLVLKHNDIGVMGDIALATKLPQNISVLYRVKMIPFSQTHPVWTVFLLIIFFPIFFFLSCMKAEREIEGCEYSKEKMDRLQKGSDNALKGVSVSLPPAYNPNYHPDLMPDAVP